MLKKIFLPFAVLLTSFSFCFSEIIKKDSNVYKLLFTKNVNSSNQLAEMQRTDSLYEVLDCNSLTSYIYNENGFVKSEHFEPDIQDYINVNQSGTGYLNIKAIRDSHILYVSGVAKDYPYPQKISSIRKFENSSLVWEAIFDNGYSNLVMNQYISHDKKNIYLFMYNFPAINTSVLNYMLYKVSVTDGSYSVIYSFSNLIDGRPARCIIEKDENDNFYISYTNEDKSCTLKKISGDGTELFSKTFYENKNNKYLIPGVFKNSNSNLGAEFFYSSNAAVSGNRTEDDYFVLFDKNTGEIKKSFFRNVSLGNNQSLSLIDIENNKFYFYISGSSLAQNNFQAVVIDENNSISEIISLAGKINQASAGGSKVSFIKDGMLYELINGSDAKDIYFVKTNLHAPMLELHFSEASNYGDSIIYPKNITSENMTINFKTKYRSVRGKAPLADYPRIHIYENEVPIFGSPFVMEAVDAGDTDYAKGVDYQYSHYFVFNHASKYTYKLQAADGTNVFDSDIYKLTPKSSGKKKVLNYPNPFNPARTNTNIVFETNKNETVRIYIYSLYGDKVFEDSFDAIAGSNEYVYDGRDNSGKVLYNGAYIVVIDKSGEKAKGKILVVK